MVAKYTFPWVTVEGARQKGNYGMKHPVFDLRICPTVINIKTFLI